MRRFVLFILSLKLGCVIMREFLGHLLGICTIQGGDGNPLSMFGTDVGCDYLPQQIVLSGIARMP